MTLYEQIGNIPMFQHFSEHDKKSVAEMEPANLAFKKGDVIIAEGGRFSSLYLLIKGAVLITKTGHTTPISKLMPGAVFGEMSFFTQKPRLSNVVADEDVLVLKMDAEFFRRVKPDIKDKIKDYLIELLIKRLDTMNESLSKISKVARFFPPE